MKIELDIKTLAIGILTGFILAVAFGFNGAADQTDFGLALTQEGDALVQTAQGDFWIVNPDTAMATRVLMQPDVEKDPSYRRTTRRVIPLNFNIGRRQEQQED